MLSAGPVPPVGGLGVTAAGGEEPLPSESPPERSHGGAAHGKLQTWRKEFKKIMVLNKAI